MKKIVFLIAFFALNQALAQYAFFRDSSGKADVKELIKNPQLFAPKQDFDFGLDNVWFWMKVPIQNTSNDKKKLYFILENPYLDLVHVYRVRNEQVIHDFGEYNFATPVENRLVKHYDFVFPMNFPPHQSDTLYIKIHRHFLKVFAPYLILEEEKFYESQFDKNLIYTLFSGVILTLILFSIIYSFVIFQVHFLYYSCYLIAVLGSVLLVEGYLIEYFQKFNFLFSIYNWRNAFNILATLSLGLFIKSLILKGAEKDKFINIIFGISIVGTVVPLILLALEKTFYENHWYQPDFLLWIPHSGYVTGLLSCFFMVIYSYFRGIQPFIAKSFLIGITPIFIYTSLSLLRNLSVLQDSFWLSYQVRLLCILFDVLVLFIGITLQIRRLHKEKDHASRLAIENELRLYKEKERISRDLHDSVGSQLTIVTTSLDNAVYLAEKQKLNVEKIEKINENVREAVQSLRDTIWVTHQEKILFADLEKRLKGYLLKAITDSLRFSIDFEGISPTVELSSAQAINLFRVLQESVQNIIKHASATEILIKCWQENNHIYFVVHDNGKGFDVANFRKNESYGLENMKNRIEEIGGNFEVKSEIAKGTKIKFSFPLA